MKFTEEHKRKISEARKGKIPWNKGIRYKQIEGKNNPAKKLEVRKKISKKLKDRTITWGDKISEAKKGIKYSEKRKKEISDRVKGKGNSFFCKKHTIQTKLKISESRKGKCIGDSNPSKRPEVVQKIRETMISRKINWQGGLSFEPYPFTWTKELRENIRKQYKNKCFKCNQPETIIDKRNGRIKKLSVHHINYIKEDTNSKNLIPLCAKCHAQVNKKRDYWCAFFYHKLEISPMG